MLILEIINITAFLHNYVFVDLFIVHSMLFFVAAAAEVEEVTVTVVVVVVVVFLTKISFIVAILSLSFNLILLGLIKVLTN